MWQQYTTPHRVCGRRSSSASCEGLNYTTGSVQYNHVCGRIIGYQIGSVDSFRHSSQSIDTYYVEGVSVTHGSPRQHIWTFAAGLDEQRPMYACPCVNGSTVTVPSFVGQNYFCESGLTSWPQNYGVFYQNGDPLWDGQGCGPTSSCCTFNSPPWFNVTLSAPTTDYIEVRICASEGIGDEDSPISAYSSCCTTEPTINSVAEKPICKTSTRDPKTQGCNETAKTSLLMQNILVINRRKEMWCI